MASSSPTHSAAAPEGAPSPSPPRSSSSDIAVARAVADAVCSLPVVLELSPGTNTLAATYGPRERVTGVIVRHHGPHGISVEVHVVLRGSLYTEALGAVSGAQAPADTAHDAVLAGAANQIREATYSAAQRLDAPPLTSVDILIDDIDNIESAP